MNYAVTFVGELFTMTVNVADVVGDDNVVIATAADMIRDYYGWHVMRAATVDIIVDVTAVAL